MMKMAMTIEYYSEEDERSHIASTLFGSHKTSARQRKCTRNGKGVCRIGLTGESNVILHKWVEQAGISKHVTFHTARHTHATMMLTLGVDLYTVSKLLGHTNIQTTQIYAKLVDESKKKAIDLIPNIS